MNTALTVLLLLLSAVTARPTFKKTATGYVSYSDRPLAKGVVALDKDETVNSVSCNPSGTSLTLQAKEKPSKLKKGVLITGGKEWGCNKSEFFFNITSVGEYKRNQLTLAVKAADKTAFFEGAKGNEGCKKLLSQAQKEVQMARKTAATATQLLKVAAQKGGAGKSEAAALTKQLKAALAKVSAAFKVISKGAGSAAGAEKVQCDLKELRAGASEVSAVLSKAKLLQRAKTSSALGAIKSATKDKNAPQKAQKQEAKKQESTKSKKGSEPAKNQTKKEAASAASRSSGADGKATVATVASTASKLLAEIKKETKTAVYKKAQTQALHAKNTVSCQLKANVTTIVAKAEHKVAKAKTCKTDGEAQKIVASLNEYLAAVKSLLRNYPALARSETERSQKTKTDASKLSKQIGTKLEQVSAIAKRCETRLAPFNAKSLGGKKGGKGAKEAADQHPDLCKELSLIKSERATVQSSAGKHKKDASKLAELKTSADGLYAKVVALQRKVDKALKKYSVYDTYNTKVTTLLGKAQKKCAALKKDDAELAASATKSIAAARSKQQEAAAALGKNSVTSANDLIQAAYQLALAAHKAATAKASDQKYTTATKQNGRQRVNVIYGNITSQLSAVKTEITTLGEYDKEKARTLRTQLQKLQKQASAVQKRARALASDKAAQNVLNEANKVAAAVTAFVQSAEKKVSDGLQPFAIKPAGNVFALPASSVQSVKCDGEAVTVRFSKKVYLDLKVGSVIQGASGCYDANTKKKGAFSRTVSKIKSNTAKKLVVRTKPTSVTSVKASGSTDSGKIEFTESPAGAYTTSKQIVSKLSVGSSGLVGRKATVAVLTAGDRAISGLAAKTVTLRRNTTVTFTVPKGVTAYNAYVKVTCDKAVARSAIPFSLNADVRFHKPDVNNQKYFPNDKLKLAWYYPGKPFKVRDVKISFVSLKDSKEVYSFKPSVGQRVVMEWSEKVKKLPAAITNGKYKLVLKVDEIQVNSVPFEVTRTDDMFTKVTFTSPKHGSSYNKGSVMTIKWDVENAHTGETMDIYLDSEDDSFWQNLGDVFNAPIVKKVEMENRRATYLVDEKLYGSSKYFLKAQWTNGQEVKSDLFTLNKQNCFSFSPASIKEVSDGKYNVTIKFKELGGCGLKSGDAITLVLAEIRSNKEVGEHKRALKAGKGSYSETFTIAGKFNKVRFLVKHKNSKKGEPSDDFDIPSVKKLNISLSGFTVNLDCSWCPECEDDKCTRLKSVDGPDGSIGTGKIKYSHSPDAKAVDLTNVWSSFCKVCGLFDKRVGKFVGDMKERLKKPDAVKKLAGDAATAKEAEQLAKQGKVSEFLSGFSAGYYPSFGITCVSCKVVGKVKAYNLDKSFLDVKSACVEAGIDYDMKIDFAVGITRFSSNKYKSASTTLSQPHRRLIDYLLKKSGHGADMEKAMTLPEANIPVAGVVAAADFLDSRVGIKLGLIVKLVTTVTGEMTFTMTASGAYQFVGYIESDTNRSGKPLTTCKPTFDLAFKSVELSATASASLLGTVEIEIPKLVAFRLQLVLVKVSATVAFKYPHYAPSSGALVANKLCSANHLFEVTLKADFITFTAKVEILKFSVSTGFDSVFSVTLAKMCLGKA